MTIFAAEAVCKITAFGPRVYAHDGWNRFDFVVAVVSVLGLIVSTGVGANAVRVLRVARVFRLIKRAKALRLMFNSLVLSLPALWNISSFIFVVMFVFAILGTRIRVAALHQCCSGVLAALICDDVWLSQQA